MTVVGFNFNKIVVEKNKALQIWNHIVTLSELERFIRLFKINQV